MLIHLQKIFYAVHDESPLHIIRRLETELRNFLFFFQINFGYPLEQFNGPVRPVERGLRRSDPRAGLLEASEAGKCDFREIIESLSASISPDDLGEDVAGFSHPGVGSWSLVVQRNDLWDRLQSGNATEHPRRM